MIGPRAILSACGNYRYRIECDVAANDGPTIAYFGINPSLAETGLHDHTTRKWTGFGLQLGAKRWLAGNAAAWRTPDVRELRLVADPIGPENEWHLQRIVADADILVPCWGARAKIPAIVGKQVVALRRLLLSSGKPVKVFGLTRCGQPMHPLMLSYRTPLIDWREAA